MLVVVFAGVVIGYALVYSGTSNFLTGGKGWGFFKSLTGKGSGTGTIDTVYTGTTPAETNKSGGTVNT